MKALNFNLKKILTILVIILVININGCSDGNNTSNSEVLNPAYSGTWTWASGSSITQESPIFPAQIGLSGSPGSLVSSATWTNNHNLWLFGGSYSQEITPSPILLISNALWEFNVTNKTWIWQGGSNKPNESVIFPSESGTQGGYPGSRIYENHWQDHDENLWIYGGRTYNESSQGTKIAADLWQYQVKNKTWVWQGGSQDTNQSPVYPIQKGLSGGYPGSRAGAVSWIDNENNLWLLGGVSNIGLMSDLWKYSIKDRVWIWQDGPTTPSEPSVYPKSYGEPGRPGARDLGSGWIDKDNNLWLFGGLNPNFAQESISVLGDLWKYNIITKVWTWENGAKTLDSSGSYPKTTGAPGGYPSSRFNNIIWTDKYDNLWLYGGLNYGATGANSLSDFWMYNIKTKMWTWEFNTNIYESAYFPENFGESGTPGSREASNYWKDTDEKIWLYGGIDARVNTESSSINVYGDLWRLN